MGLFDRFKKKPEPAPKAAPAKKAEAPKQEQPTDFDDFYKPVAMNSDLSREITQSVAIFMYQAGITEQPGLSFFKNDSGMFEGIYVQHTTNPAILQLKQMPGDMYLKICGMHAFGAGAYITACQLDFKHPVEAFTSAEVQQIANAFRDTDAYELALKRLGIPLESRNKQVLDHIIITALETAKEVVGSRVMDPQNLKAYMQVLFNAGISMYMLRKIR